MKNFPFCFIAILFILLGASGCQTLTTDTNDSSTPGSVSTEENTMTPSSQSTTSPAPTATSSSLPAKPPAC